MQGEILLVNPRRRKRSHRARGAGGRFVKTHRAKRKNARRRRRNPIAAIAANPRRRRRRKNPLAAIAANPRRRRRHNRRHRARARRRNPRFAMAGGSLKRMLIPASLGAIGAVALDAAMAAATPYIPVQLQSGPLKMVTRVVGAFGLGWLAGKIKPGLQAPVVLGGLTVAAYFAARDLAARFAPQIPLQGYMEGDIQLGYTDPAPALQGYQGGMGAYMAPGGDLGAYMSPGGDLGNMTTDGM